MNTSKRLATGLFAIGLLLSFAAVTRADDQNELRAAPLKVVTQNLYVGGDILLPLTVPPDQFPQAAAQVIGQIVATNYPERAMRLAELMRHEWPHLVGLQEVYEIKVCFDMARTSCLLDQDYLEILLDNLNDRFETYREVATVTNIVLENLPAVLPTNPPVPVYVSITDRDVILAHRFVQTGNPVIGNYVTALPVNNPLLPGFSVLRGYAMVDAVVTGRPYRFVNTHLEVTGSDSPLEPFFRAVQAGQALELVTLLQQGDQTQVVVGDFNSDPFDGPLVACAVPDGMGGTGFTSCPTPYAVLSQAGYTDTWLYRDGPFEFGYTCCQATLLDNELSQLDERVDLVWARPAADYAGVPFLVNVRANVIGEEDGDKTVPSGLWPSDHGGVAARLILRTPK